MKRKIKRVFVVYVSLFLIGASFAEAQWRTWTSRSGSKIEAKLVKTHGQSVILQRKENGKKITVKIKQLSKADQQYIVVAPKPEMQKGATSITVNGVKMQAGKTSGEIKCLKKKRWSYFAYLPKSFHAGKKWPIWFIASPGGGAGGGALNRYKKGADRLGCILALSVQSRNSFDGADEALATMVDDVYAHFPIIESLSFSTGFSGGSRMAYKLAEEESRIAGVLACGSGSGIYLTETDFRTAKLRKSTYIYSLMGTNCFNRDEAVRSHKKFSKSYRLRFFPAGHSWAGSPYIEEGMARVLGEALMRSKSRGLEDIKTAYAKEMLKWTLELKETAPWEAFWWAEFLKNFKGSFLLKGEAGKIYSELKSNPQVDLAAKAEKDIKKFCKKHFSRYISQKEGKKADPRREAEAKKLAKKYKGLPYEILLQRLGNPS